MRKPLTILSLAIALLVPAAAVLAQVNVTVDGSPVQFTGMRPLSQSGRILVPLRGVLEKIGAEVGWVSATRTVVAQKGDLFVELPVGSKTASVNGKQVVLDVPAAVIAGSTMVPLRFLGEALGADVKWDGPSKTVLINTGGTPADAALVAQTGIASFTHDASGWLKPGSTIHVTLTGAPGGEAFFEIPGAMNSAKMTETSAGRYSGSWTVPASARITVSDSAVIGVLKADGKERMIQAGQNVSIDTVAPKITDIRPAADSKTAQTRPAISVVLDDAGGSGIDASSVKMTVNGTDVTDQAVISGSLAAYRPAKALPGGDVAVAVTAKDMAGNTASIDWKFTVRATSDVIKSFTHSDIKDVQPGDVIVVDLKGEPNGTASFAIVQEGRTLRTRPMTEISAGAYQGEYTVRRDDRLAGAKIVGTLKTPAGETFTTESEDAIGGATSALTPPVITQPAAGTGVKSPVTVKGTAAPESRVRIRLEYATTVLGMRMTGAITEQVLDVNTKGEFASQPISLGTLVKGKNTEYTLTAATVEASGEESETVTVTFTGS